MDMMAKGRICAAIAALCMTVAGGFAFADQKLYMGKLGGRDQVVV